MYKYLGNSIFSTGVRVNKKLHSITGSSYDVLLTWSQPRCQVCKRFLSKKQRKVCAKCKPSHDREVINNICRIRYHNDPIYREIKNHRRRKQ